MTPLPSQEILDDDELKAIGCLALEATFLENFTDGCICTLCDLDNATGELFIGQIMIRKKIDLLKKLTKSRLKTQAAKDEFQKIYDKITDSITKRNTAIHGTWEGLYNLSQLLDPAPRLPALRIATRKKGDPLHSKDIMKIAEGFADQLSELKTFYRTHWAELAPP